LPKLGFPKFLFKEIFERWSGGDQIFSGRGLGKAQGPDDPIFIKKSPATPLPDPFIVKKDGRFEKLKPFPLR
jgi:hypothetical protein